LYILFAQKEYERSA